MLDSTCIISRPGIHLCPGTTSCMCQPRLQCNLFLLGPPVMLHCYARPAFTVMLACVWIQMWAAA